MSERLIAWNNLPGVRPLGVGETWRQIFEKCVLKVTGSEATNTCKDEQICTGLKEGIDGEVQRVIYIWKFNSTEENWG